VRDATRASSGTADAGAIDRRRGEILGADLEALFPAGHQGVLALGDGGVVRGEIGRGEHPRVGTGLVERGTWEGIRTYRTVSPELFERIMRNSTADVDGR